MFKEFNKALRNEVNSIITTYQNVSKSIDGFIEEYYMKEQRLD